MPVNPRPPSPHTLRRRVTRASIIGGVFWTAALLILGFAGVFHANIALFAGIAIVTGVLFGLFWHRWIRENRGRDREYRPVSPDSEAGRDRTGDRPWRYLVFPSLIILLIPVYFGLAVFHYLQGSCHLAWQCLQPGGSFLSNWFFILLALGGVVEWIEKRRIKRRRQSPAARQT
jgi:hypothetical protein